MNKNIFVNAGERDAFIKNINKNTLKHFYTGMVQRSTHEMNEIKTANYIT